MPIVNVHLFEGRTLEQKRRLVDEVTKAICNSIEVPADAVRIILMEMERTDFAVGGVLASDKNK
ncbi:MULTISPECIES: 4-oxalocrotonate tautomerase [Aminobacterium]|jgi:4-oxalocrotonate tautomerase|uniref:Tautomerase n=1 Tax=Aminobacterium colombiense (strain DSM 12261 / ALA-1) TaxID=572547 RepID=D5EFM5_AMICL|nr:MULTISPECIES: 4-oxalocrotonate tautomerase [Aminobacterium]MDD2379397.1 4-oxalocrotonate tautomerase [Aminobacterium colombiense]ADE57357.1 4-oxalocrotonate tautomerase family enzyme [Aminobacterium colombiense DSM 12261]MDD3767830.1 4-oxalocrotonate tautomerase [Aminobacterium colombiense]MDD4265890.1 4-oxalocrotonate tautomerase [Aminobacterium colombiense]MDD4586288.1 4-oxalocrotonate tautomerase [Aminobacterium colombiense]